MTKPRPRTKMVAPVPKQFLGDIRTLINQARQHLATANILCSGKKREQIELLKLDASGIHVAEYVTVLPPREVLQVKLHEAIARLRARFENRAEENG